MPVFFVYMLVISRPEKKIRAALVSARQHPVRLIAFKMVLVLSAALHAPDYGFISVLLRLHNSAKSPLVVLHGICLCQLQSLH